MLVAKREPTPCYHVAYSVGTPRWAFGRKACKITVRPRFPPCLGMFSWLTKGLYSFWEVGNMDAPYWEGQASRAWQTVFYPWAAVG